MKTLGDEILKLVDEMDIEEANVVEVSRTAKVFKHFEATGFLSGSVKIGIFH